MKRMEAQGRATATVYQDFVRCIVGAQKSKPAEGRRRRRRREEEKEAGGLREKKKYMPPFLPVLNSYDRCLFGT